MKDRCFNENNTHYYLYGGRGIDVSQEWIESFEIFFQDMGECPKAHSLDRIDNNKGYSKENCRWATRNEQQRNRRDNIRISHLGETKTIAEWTEITGVPRSRIKYGIEHGWELKDILQKDVGKHYRTQVVGIQTC
jgi:Fic family protein